MPGLDWAILSGYIVAIVMLALGMAYGVYKARRGGAG